MGEPTIVTSPEAIMVMVPVSDFYQGKNVLVIGGAGFVGSYLVSDLVKLGAGVTVLDNYSRAGGADPRVRNYKIGTVPYIYGDCSNEGTCRDHFKDRDVIFNLAATVAGVIYNQSHHAQMFSENLAVQAMPLKIAAEYHTPRFLHVSSVCVYAEAFNSPSVEEFGFAGEVTKANEGYSLAKRMGEKLADWYWNELSLDVVRVRPTNIYGPRDYFDHKAHVVPALIKKCLEDDEIVVNGTGEERRELIHVRDVARGMLAAASHGSPGAVYNLGTNGATCITIRQLVGLIKQATNTEKKPVTFKSSHDPGDNARWTDSVRANLDLDWVAEEDLTLGLKETVEWYASHRDV